MNEKIQILKNLLVILIITLKFAYSQQSIDNNQSDTSYNKYKLPSIFIGPSIFSYQGELNEQNKIPFATNFDIGLSVGIEYRWKKFYGINFTSNFSYLHQNETKMPFRNFKTSFYNFQLNNIFYFDNDLFLKYERGFSPLIFAGIGLCLFDPYSDLKDANGLKYYYWNDGTIRDRPRNPDNPYDGIILQKDYVYETKIDSSNNIPNSAIIIPLGIGLRYKLSDFFELTFSFSYNLTSTDFLDGVNNNIKGNKLTENDAFFYSGITLQYNLGAKKFLSPAERIYANVDFSSLDKEDSDGDGVVDPKDKCPGTPRGIEVDEKGCPKDTDGDGIPDYRDKEPNSITGAQVDENGITITDKMIYELYQLDSMLTLGYYPDSMKYKLKKDTTSRIDIKNIAEYEIPDLKSRRKNVIMPTETPNEKYIEISNENKKQKTTTNDHKITDLFYTVQIAYSEALVEDDFFYKKYNLTENVYVAQKQGYKYYVGNFSNRKQAEELANKLKKEHNITDAFVTQVPAGMIIKSLVIPEHLKVKTVKYNPNNIPEIKEISEDQKGLIYRIQISSRATKLPPEYFLEKYNITDEVFVSFQDGAYKYSIGKFEKYEDAKKFNEEFKQQYGIMDSYVTPYLDGKRISINEALRIQNKK